MCFLQILYYVLTIFSTCIFFTVTDRCIKDTIEVHECTKLKNLNMWSLWNKSMADHFTVGHDLTDITLVQ